MYLRVYVFLALFVVLTLGVEVGLAQPYQSGNFDSVRPNVDSWVCYDYAINYARENPEWGVVAISNNPCFYGIAHMVNYKIENNTLQMYDSQYNVRFHTELDTNLNCMKIGNAWFAPSYYKFWSVDETPLRNYKRLQDNSRKWLNV